MDKTNPVRFALGLALLAGTLTAAQTPSTGLRSDPNAPIVVTGQRPTRAEARERAAAFVRELGVAQGERPVARWADRVCPVVRGIAEPYARIVETRMRAIAAAAGIVTAPEGCRPNISVSFVGDAAGLVQEVARRSPTRLNEVRGSDRDALLNGAAPVRWWYITETRSRHAMRNAPQSIQTETGGQSGGSSTASGPLEAESMSQYNSSVISTQANRVLLDAAVVIDFDGVSGRSLEAVAAYAAFVAFAEVRAADAAPPASILGMFGANAGPVDAMTDWDMAFLRALYRLPLDRQARRHRGILVREMVDFQTGS